MNGLQEIKAKNFFIPNCTPGDNQDLNARVCAIIPTHKPSPIWTVKLVKDLLHWNKKIDIVVVDDCTPLKYEEEYGVFKKIKDLSSRVTLIRTPQNRLKAGAINYSLEKLFSSDNRPSVIITLDDDVVIEKHTIKRLVSGLLANDNLGVVCSQCRALNKNKNIITRLQGLEYLNFNTVRLADAGFYHGPLVMHGMLSAFRSEVFFEAGMFAESHLIEDYEMTARIKTYGWCVQMIPSAYAWTEVPETFSELWNQRVRWVYGGITVLLKTRPKSVLQDVLGHSVFIATLILIITFYLVESSEQLVSPLAVNLIIIFSLAQVVIWYVFQIWNMKFYSERDTKDWIIRASLIPEFIYANILSLVLLGAYLFFLFNSLLKLPVAKLPIIKSLFNGVGALFAKIGYSQHWGTR